MVSSDRVEAILNQLLYPAKVRLDEHHQPRRAARRHGLGGFGWGGAEALEVVLEVEVEGRRWRRRGHCPLTSLTTFLSFW